MRFFQRLFVDFQVDDLKVGEMQGVSIKILIFASIVLSALAPASRPM